MPLFPRITAPRVAARLPLKRVLRGMLRRALQGTLQSFGVPRRAKRLELNCKVLYSTPSTLGAR